MQLHFWFCFWQAANHYVTMVFLEWTDIISTDSKVLRCWLAGLVWHGSTWFNNAKLWWRTSKPPFISASHQSYKGRGVFSSNPPEPQKRSKKTVLAFDCVRFKWFDITLHCMCTNRTRARRAAEVSRFKKCNLTGSKKKVCLQELRQTSMLFSGTSDLLWQIMNSSNDFSPLVNSFQWPSFLCTSSWLSSTLFSSRSSPLHALLSTRVGSPHLSSTCPFFLSQSKWHSCKLSCSGQSNCLSIRSWFQHSIVLSFACHVLSFNPTGLLTVACRCNIHACLGRSQITARSRLSRARPNMPSKHARTTRVKLLRTEAFTQRSFCTWQTVTQRNLYRKNRFYTEKRLHRESVTQRKLSYKGTFRQRQLQTKQCFTHRSFYAKQLLHREAIAQSKFVHREAVAQRCFYTDNLVSWKAFTKKALPQRSCYTEIAFTQSQLLHKESSYTEKFFYLNEALTQRSFYTEKCDTKKLLHRDSVYTGPAFTQGKLSQTDKFFYTRKPLHREAFTQRTFYTEKLVHRAVYSIFTSKTRSRRPSGKTTVLNHCLKGILKGKSSTPKMKKLLPKHHSPLSCTHDNAI